MDQFKDKMEVYSEEQGELFNQEGWTFNNQEITNTNPERSLMLKFI